MKKLMIGIVLLLMFAGCTPFEAFGQVVLSDLQNGVFHLSASGFVNEVISKGGAVSSGYRVASDIGLKMADWVFVQAAQSGSIDVEYPDSVYINFASRLNYQYAVEVAAGNEAPTGCAVDGSDIECDEPTNSQVLALFSWDGATFTDTEATATGGVFSGVSAGNYVVGYTGDEFCTTFLTVSE